MRDEKLNFESRFNYRPINLENYILVRKRWNKEIYLNYWFFFFFNFAIFNSLFKLFHGYSFYSWSFNCSLIITCDFDTLIRFFFSSLWCNFLAWHGWNDLLRIIIPMFFFEPWKIPIIRRYFNFSSFNNQRSI